MRPTGPRCRGFTLIELMVVVGLVVVLIALAAPSARRMIDVQRVNSINAQLVTDLQFARAEAATRNANVRLTFGSDAARSCYTLYTYTSNAGRCDCLAAPVCTAVGSVEIRTVSIPRDTGVAVLPAAALPIEFAFEPVTGALFKIPTDFISPPLRQYVINTGIDLERMLRTTINLGGRATVCAPAGSKMAAAPCP
ncbi:MAG: GspH/FimT family pseudopilin [Rubrivivax sp.]|nr:GspH/FimT family pseudopilin [Rubrivivax sp.]